MVQMIEILNKTGLIQQFYTLLWSKRDKNEEIIYDFIIPHTIVYEQNQPKSWYFSSKEGYILQKRGKNITPQDMIDILSNNPSPSGIAGQYMYTKEGEHRVQVEYISLDQLEDFILKDKKPYPSGVYQKFVDPSGTKNSMIECIWSPNITLFEKRVNRKNLNEKRLDIFERAVTFDGDQIYSEMEYVKGTGLSQQIRKSIEQITKHVMSISYEKYELRRMVVYFKIDKNQKVNFLWCSQARSNNEKYIHAKARSQEYVNYFVENNFHNSPLKLEMNPLSGGGQVKRVYTTYLVSPKELVKTRICFRCQKNYTNNDMVMLPIKFLIDNFDEHMKLNPDQLINQDINMKIKLFSQELGENDIRMQRSLKIPFEINQLYPNLKEEEYNYLKSLPKFQIEEISVCEECYLFLVWTQGITSGQEQINYMTEKQLEQDKGYLNQKQTILYNDAEITKKKTDLNLEIVNDLYNVLYKSPKVRENLIKVKKINEQDLAEKKFKNTLERIYEKSQKKQIQDLISQQIKGETKQSLNDLELGQDRRQVQSQRISIPEILGYKLSKGLKNIKSLQTLKNTENSQSTQNRQTMISIDESRNQEKEQQNQQQNENEQIHKLKKQLYKQLEKDSKNAFGNSFSNSETQTKSKSTNQINKQTQYKIFSFSNTNSRVPTQPNSTRVKYSANNQQQNNFLNKIKKSTSQKNNIQVKPWNEINTNAINYNSNINNNVFYSLNSPSSSQYKSNTTLNSPKPNYIDINLISTQNNPISKSKFLEVIDSNRSYNTSVQSLKQFQLRKQFSKK